MIPNEANIIHKARQLHYPTPFFFTSKEVLKHNYETFVSLFDNAEIYYALKANSDSRILWYLNELGCGFEAASAYEIEMLLKVGVDPAKIIYGSSVKPASHIEKAVEYGVKVFAADSKEEVEKLAKYAPGSKVYIRAIVDDEGSVFTMSERFGAPIDQVKDILLHVKHNNLKMHGISFYVGSQATNVDRWANGIRTIKPIIEELYKEGVTLDVINIGGGFPVEYSNHAEVPHLKEIVSRINNALHELPYIPKLYMEPGRGIVASSTVLVAEVMSRTVRRDDVWLCLDGGIYNALYEAMIHQGSTQYIVHPYTLPEDNTSQMTCTLAGPTGDSLDIITRNAIIPSYTTVEDKLIFENAGAYTLSLSCSFNGFPKPELYIG
jgi:ornithine decarboxylase